MKILAFIAEDCLEMGQQPWLIGRACISLKKGDILFAASQEGSGEYLQFELTGVELYRKMFDEVPAGYSCALRLQPGLPVEMVKFSKCKFYIESFKSILTREPR